MATRVVTPAPFEPVAEATQWEGTRRDAYLNLLELRQSTLRQFPFASKITDVDVSIKARDPGKNTGMSPLSFP